MFLLRSWDTVARLCWAEILLKGLTPTATWNCGIKRLETWNNLNTHLKQLFQKNRIELSSTGHQVAGWSLDKVTKRVNDKALNLIDCRFLGVASSGSGEPGTRRSQCSPKAEEAGLVIGETHGSWYSQDRMLRKLHRSRTFRESQEAPLSLRGRPSEQRNAGILGKHQIKKQSMHSPRTGNPFCLCWSMWKSLITPMLWAAWGTGPKLQNKESLALKAAAVWPCSKEAKCFQGSVGAL